MSGAITTLGCGILLLFCNFTFFKKFGIVIVVTVLFSFAVATLAFGAAGHWFGPQKNFGNIDCCCRRDKERVEPAGPVPMATRT